VGTSWGKVWENEPTENLVTPQFTTEYEDAEVKGRKKNPSVCFFKKKGPQKEDSKRNVCGLGHESRVFSRGWMPTCIGETKKTPKSRKRDVLCGVGDHGPSARMHKRKEKKKIKGGRLKKKKLATAATHEAQRAHGREN